MKKSKLLFLTFIVFSLFFISASVSAKSLKRLVIGVENINHFPHFNNSKGEYFGFSREVIDLFARKNSYDITYEILPLKRLFSTFVKGNSLDFKYPDHPKWQAGLKEGTKIFYSAPVVGYKEGIMVRPERFGKGVDNLKILGMVLGYTPWPYLDRINDGRIKVRESKEFQSVLKMVLGKRIDGSYMNEAVAKYQLKDGLNKKGGLKLDTTLPFISDFYYLSSKKHPKIIKQFNRFLIQKKSKIDQLKLKYGI